MNKIFTKIRYWMICLAAWIIGETPDFFKEELALTAYELKAEGRETYNFLFLYVEALNRYAEETLKVERAPAYYRQMLDDATTLEDLGRIAMAAQDFGDAMVDFAAAAREGKKAIDDLARATKGINFNDLDDLI